MSDQVSEVVDVGESTAPAPKVNGQQSPQAPKADVKPIEPKRPKLPSREIPADFKVLPESVYRWTPDTSNGVPPRGLLVSGREPIADKDGNVIPGRLVMYLLEPAVVLTRAGKQMILKEGHRIRIPMSDALLGLVPVANHLAGMVCVKIIPEAPVSVMEDGAKEWGYTIAWQIDEETGKPKLYSREIVKQDVVG